MKFDEIVNHALNEKFGTPGKVRSRKAVGTGITSRDPNAWKDPLKKHHMKDVRGTNRKKMGWVPKSQQTEPALSMGQRVLNLAKDADQGIWELSLVEALPIAKKYKMNIPNARKPARRLGSTGIVMYLRWDNQERRYRLFLVKHEKLLRSALKHKKQTTKPALGRIKSGKTSTMTRQAKRPKKAMSPMFGKGKSSKYYTPRM